MYCIKCGNEVNKEMDFCPNCGAKIYHNVIDIVEEEKPTTEKENGPWKNFAMTGHVLGILALCLFWFAGAGFYLGVFGIVFSSLGKKSKVRHDMAVLGFKRSLIGTILALSFVTLMSLIKVAIKFLSN